MPRLFQICFERREDKTKKFDKHVALFVKTDGEEEGLLFHAIENHDRITDTVLVLSFDERKGDPKRHRSYMNEVYVGTIAEDKIDSLRTICASTPDVIAPQTSTKPDCVTWINNVLYDLHKHRVVRFEKNFKIPTEKIALQSCSENTSKHSGSSSSAKDKGSSSPAKDKGSSSSRK